MDNYQKNVSMDVPTVDMDSKDEADLQQRWDKAFHEIGFVVLQNHGIPLSLITDLRAAAMKFFQQPIEQKMKYCIDPKYGKGGYTRQGVESVARSKGANSPPDLVESFVFKIENDIRPEYPPNFSNLAAEYFRQCENLLVLVMKLSAKSLDLDEDFFNPFYQPGKRDLRLAYYAPQETRTVTDNRALRYGAHTDYQGFTILSADPEVEGLQVALQNDSDITWTTVHPGTLNAMVINSGDMIERWTNNYWKSTLHRVNNAAVGKARLSMAFFTGPSDDTVLRCLPSRKCQEHQKEEQPPILAGEHLMQNLTRSNVK